MKNFYISNLVIFKILVSSIILYFFSVFLGWDMFKYPDFYSAYSDCSEYNTNILYGELFCSINYITGQNFTHKSPIFIFIAVIVNMLILIGYFKLFEKYLKRSGKYLFIFLLVIHPYMGIYFFRFYTELFASLGIFLIAYYVVRNKKIDTFFIVSGFILMNFRVALIPVFFVFSIFEIFKRSNKKNTIIAPLVLIIFSIISLVPVIDFGIEFAAINSNLTLVEKIPYNFVFTLGFREAFVGGFREAFWGGDPLSVAIDNPAIFIAKFKFLDYVSILVSVILLVIHFIGIFGAIKFSINKKLFSLSVLFLYILMPLISIAHMRYLLPLMPIILFGFSYIFFMKTKNI